MTSSTNRLELLLERRDDALARGDLRRALELDDDLEDLGMHGDDRATCHGCQVWGDHAHELLTGRRITLAEYEQQRRARTARRR
ncbi:hypothetical protein ACQP2U_43560 (plasmid) [Nocardia sp. CA-084685]|uniref:hypothetical protein n=1 Tax=Nocardia sp. CA-084685 TaxID=3239970 RepID=UPI003D974E4E